MEVTIQIPDELYRMVKAKSAAQGRRVRDVSIELFHAYVHGAAGAPARQTPEEWLAAWLAAALDAGVPLLSWDEELLARAGALTPEAWLEGERPR